MNFEVGLRDPDLQGAGGDGTYAGLGLPTFRQAPVAEQLAAQWKHVCHMPVWVSDPDRNVHALRIHIASACASRKDCDLA